MCSFATTSLPGELRNTVKVLTRYLVHEQNSVFAGDLPESKLLKLRSELGSIAVPEDRVIEITAANKHNVSISLLQKIGYAGRWCTAPAGAKRFRLLFYFGRTRNSLERGPSLREIKG